MHATSQVPDVGLFQVGYEIGTETPGAPNLSLRLVVDTPTAHLSGVARLSQVTAPPFPALAASVRGDYTYMATMKSSHILVVAAGYPILYSQQGGAVSAETPNLHLRMVLEPGWESGTATYRYSLDGSGWTSVDGVPVRQTDVGAPSKGDEAVLLPDSVEATWNDGILTVRAQGKEDGYTDIHIDDSPADIEPMLLQLSAMASPTIGLFPYDVTRRFPMEENPGEILFREKGGDRRISVKSP